jgi:hypothetical protein
MSIGRFPGGLSYAIRVWRDVYPDCGQGLKDGEAVPHVWIARGEAAPICPGCGTPYRKATDYPNYPLVAYRAEYGLEETVEALAGCVLLRIDRVGPCVQDVSIQT